MRKDAIFTIWIMIFSVQAVWADDGSAITPSSNDYSAVDASLSYVSGAVIGAGVGYGAGNLTFALMSSDCGEENMCLGESFVAALAGGAGFLFGTPLGVYLYGEYRALGGSYWMSFWGTAGGALVGGLTAFANEDLALIATPALGVAGGVWAYYASIPNHQGQAQRSEAEAASLGVPMLTYDPRSGGRYMLNFVGGHF